VDFLPRDVMLARYLLSSRVRLFVCLSVTIRYCIETTERIELQASFHLSYTVLYVKDTDKEECLRPFIHIGLDWIGCVIRKLGLITVLPSGTLSQTPDFKNFATASGRWGLLTTHATVDASRLSTTRRSTVTV